MARTTNIKKSYQDVWVSRDTDGESCWKFNVNFWLDKPMLDGNGTYNSEDDTAQWVCSISIDEFHRLYGFTPHFGVCQLVRLTIHPRSGKQMHAERKGVKKEKVVEQPEEEAHAEPKEPAPKGRLKLRIKR